MIPDPSLRLRAVQSPIVPVMADELCRRLVEEYAVARLPGAPYGCSEECVIRVSYGALVSDRFELALQRLTKGLTAIIEH